MNVSMRNETTANLCTFFIVSALPALAQLGPDGTGRVNGYRIEPNADLRGANLRGANLGNARLRSSNLQGANLFEATICDADLTGPISAMQISTTPASDGLFFKALTSEAPISGMRTSTTYTSLERSLLVMA